jgi:hypothetical protein
VFTTGGTYPWSFVTQIFHNGPPNHGGDCKTFEVMTSTIERSKINTPSTQIHDCSVSWLAAYNEDTEGFLLVKLKSSLRKFYSRHHDLVDRYGISVSQMTTDMFHLS